VCTKIKGHARFTAFRYAKAYDNEENEVKENISKEADEYPRCLFWGIGENLVRAF
jgi:hypothetical protein